MDCFSFPGITGIYIHPTDVARLHAAQKINGHGGASYLRFPTLAELFKDDALPVIVTRPFQRIDNDPSKVDNRYLEGLLRNRLRFSREKRSWRYNYPHAYLCPQLDHPVIVHSGLVDKILEKRCDSDHVRFAGYVGDAIQNPSEVYTDTDEGRPVFRLIAALSVGGRPAFMHLVVDRESHILDTAYVPHNGGRPWIEGYRKDTPTYLAWAIAVSP